MIPTLNTPNITPRSHHSDACQPLPQLRKVFSPVRFLEVADELGRLTMSRLGVLRQPIERGHQLGDALAQQLLALQRLAQVTCQLRRVDRLRAQLRQRDARRRRRRRWRRRCPVRLLRMRTNSQHIIYKRCAAFIVIAIGYIDTITCSRLEPVIVYHSLSLLELFHQRQYCKCTASFDKLYLVMKPNIFKQYHNFKRYKPNLRL